MSPGPWRRSVAALHLYAPFPSLSPRPLTPCLPGVGLTYLSHACAVSPYSPSGGCLPALCRDCSPSLASSDCFSPTPGDCLPSASSNDYYAPHSYCSPPISQRSVVLPTPSGYSSLPSPNYYSSLQFLYGAAFTSYLLLPHWPSC